MRDIEDGRLDYHRPIVAAFILSGAVQPDSLAGYIAWFEELVTTLRGFHLSAFDRVGSASTVFSYLHATWLHRYREEATTLVEVVRKKEFNCVAGTILFNLICDEFGWQTEAFETPTHVYTVFSDFTKVITVENTSSMGFDIMHNLREYSQYLLQFYPKNRAAQIGLDRIYAHENARGRRISNIELLGLLAYNRAYFARNQQDYALAYQFVGLAQKFNRDSRSNISFEIDLYFRWGTDLYKAGEYTSAFNVFADGVRRHPEVKELSANAESAFFNALAGLWQKRDWPKSRTLIDKMESLGILTDAGASQLLDFLKAWRSYLAATAQPATEEECAAILSRLYPDRPVID